jgi:hypothetical protein
MRRRLIALSAFVLVLAGGAAASAAPANAAAGVGKTGLYKDGCGNTQIWVNGENLGPYYLVCMPPAADH